jgi:hypothetical protein
MSKKHPLILKQEIEASEVKPNDIWKHYKGDYYLVKEIAIDCNTNELLVIYTNIMNTEVEGVMFSRTHREWTEEVEPGVKRFTHTYISYTEQE